MQGHFLAHGLPKPPKTQRFRLPLCIPFENMSSKRQSTVTHTSKKRDSFVIGSQTENKQQTIVTGEYTTLYLETLHRGLQCRRHAAHTSGAKSRRRLRLRVQGLRLFDEDFSKNMQASLPRGSVYTTIMELGPQNHNKYGLSVPIIP